MVVEDGIAASPGQYGRPRWIAVIPECFLLNLWYPFLRALIDSRTFAYHAATLSIGSLVNIYSYSLATPTIPRDVNSRNIFPTNTQNVISDTNRAKPRKGERLATPRVPPCLSSQLYHKYPISTVFRMSMNLAKPLHETSGLVFEV